MGVETLLLGTEDSQVLHVPLTYRAAPLPSAEAALITTMTHSALGDRWVYDGCSDPVWLSALVTTVLTGGREADLFLATATGLVPEPVLTHVRGSGSPASAVPPLSPPVVTHEGTTTRVHAGVAVTLLRVPSALPAAGAVLTGTWPGQATPLLLATVDVRP